MREVRDLSLNADLVTLSACDTGVGPLEGEEGIANLVRAFLFAGAKSVVASLWTANDPSTRTLMGRFYRYIADGEEKGSALRHAQMDLIAEFGERACPYTGLASSWWATGRLRCRCRPVCLHRGMRQAPQQASSHAVEGHEGLRPISPLMIVFCRSDEPAPTN